MYRYVKNSIGNIKKNAHVVDDIDDENAYVGVVSLYQGVYERTPFLFDADAYSSSDLYDIIDHILDYCAREGYTSFYRTRNELDEDELEHATEFSGGRYLDEESMHNISEVHVYDLADEDDRIALYNEYGFYVRTETSDDSTQR